MNGNPAGADGDVGLPIDSRHLARGVEWDADLAGAKSFLLAESAGLVVSSPRFGTDLVGITAGNRGMKHGALVARPASHNRADANAHSRRGPSPLRNLVPVWESIGDCRMSRTGRRRNDGKSSLELKKLRAETGIAERQLEEMRLRMIYETVKVWLAILIAFNATIVMFKTIGLFL